jgi:hypothetical protein
MKKLVLSFVLLFSLSNFSQEIALLKYSGGGDWYANPTSLPNLIAFSNQTIQTKLTSKPVTVEPGSPDLFSYPFVHMTGHGNVVFSDNELKNLQNYLNSGGFLHVDDNFGMDKYIRKDFKKLFPANELVEIPANHVIFQKPFNFPSGLPKIHEHENKKPQAFGIFIEGRLALLYTFESDLGDGWEDEEVHHDPKEIREKALKMGANILSYVFLN